MGSDTSLMRISAQHCNRHVSKASCLNAMDPYCGWNELQEACTAPPNGDTLTRYWVQNSTACPLLTAGYGPIQSTDSIRNSHSFYLQCCRWWMVGMG